MNVVTLRESKVGLRCLECGHPNSTVRDSRPRDRAIRRRRVCLKCGHRWTTWEIPADAASLLDEIERIPEMLRTIAEQVDGAATDLRIAMQDEQE